MPASNTQIRHHSWYLNGLSVTYVLPGLGDDWDTYRDQLSVPVRAAIDEARCAGARNALGEDISPGGVPAPAGTSPVHEKEEGWLGPSEREILNQN